MKRRQIRTDIEGISAEVIYHQIQNQEVKTLVVDFGQKYHMLSTACGYKKLRYAANHYIPRILWEYNLDHFNDYLTQVHHSLQIDPGDIAMLVTGVDMDNLAQKYSDFGELKIGCFATAGVKGNALRMGVDKSQVEGPGIPPSSLGTINVILFTNANFSDGAMSMVFINITEAKAGALQDLNVHSVYTPQNIATGTGTDGIIVASGYGIDISSTSGHLKIGELIGGTVREAVIEALEKQDGLTLPLSS